LVSPISTEMRASDAMRMADSLFYV
jgi:hypothetical protein